MLEHVVFAAGVAYPLAAPEFPYAIQKEFAMNLLTPGLLFGALVFSAAMMPDAAHAAMPYAIQQSIQLGDASKWDYLDIDQVRRRLYVSRGERVQVVDTTNGKVIGEIAGTSGVHGIAFSQELKSGYTSNGKANSITVFDLETLAVKTVISIPGVNPDAILYEAVSRKLYTFNGKSQDVTVLDANSLKVLTTIKVTGKPEFAAADGQGRIFVNIEDKAEVLVIDVATDRISAKWPLKSCEEPTGLALDSQHGRLFSVCQNRVMIVTDTKTGANVAKVAIGEHPDAAIYDADTATVLSSNGGGNGSLTVVKQLDADHYAATEVPTHKGARTMALDHTSKSIYLPVVEDKKMILLEMRPVK